MSYFEVNWLAVDSQGVGGFEGEVEDGLLDII